MTPKYQQLANTLKQDIKTRLRPGDRMVSQRELMKTYNLSLATVDSALRLLVNEGLLVRLQGKGTFVNSVGAAENGENLAGRIYIFCELSPADDYLHMLYNAIRDELANTETALSLVTYTDTISKQIACREGLDAAILIAPNEKHRELIRQFEINHIPAVLIGAEWPDINLPLVDSDNEGGVCMAVQYLVAHGHRRLCYIDRDDPTIHSRIRKRSFLQQAERLNLTVEDDWCIDMPPARLDERVRADLDRIFTQKIRPTAVMFGGLLMHAMLVMSELKALGLRLPEDVSVIGFDDPAWASCTEPRITVVKQPLDEVGRRAVRMLRNQMDGRIYARREILQDELIERKSVAQAKT